ncbi:Crp/Fnr family transcriptional regulator, partial [Staphylococcus felis]
NNGLYNLYMKLLVLENIKKDMFIRDMLTRNKLSSFLSVLIRLSNTFGVVEKDMVIIKIKITQEELAQYCGTTRENVARIIKQLKDKNILDTSSHFIKVINIEEIKKMIPCENCENSVCNSF